MQVLTQTVRFPEALDDASVAWFQEEIDAAIAAPATVVLVDFSQVEFISSPALMTLVVAFKRIREAGKSLLLCSINEQVRMLLELTGMDQVFEVVETTEPTEELVPA